jgi:uncharacterized protein YukE
MEDSELVYNKAHMDGIRKKYSDIADKIKDSYMRIEKAADGVRTLYKGGGNLMFDEAANATAEHLRLLEICAQALSKYVNSTFAEMRKKDRELSNVFRGDGRW